MKLKFPRHIFYALVATLLASTAAAECDFSGKVGWTIMYSGTVTGYIDEDGEQDEFEGCEHGRVLIVDYSKTITCAEYNYSYAYMPDIVILWRPYEKDGKKYDFYEACIDGDMYDIHINSNL